MPATLLQRIAAGDSTAVQACIQKYGALVWSLSLRLSTSRADAEDAVQEIFINLWKSADRFKPERSTETAFIAMVARRRLIDRRRAAERRKEDSTPAVDLEGMMSFDHERMVSCVEAQTAARALASLPDDRRLILRLALCEGFTHAQIAKSTKMPLGTVKSHLRRGLQTVREMLRDDASLGEVTQQ